MRVVPADRIDSEHDIDSDHVPGASREPFHTGRSLILHGAYASRVLVLRLSDESHGSVVRDVDQVQRVRSLGVDNDQHPCVLQFISHKKDPPREESRSSPSASKVKRVCLSRQTPYLNPNQAAR